MIKARGEGFVLLGLSSENLRRLKAGRPIKIPAGEPLGLDYDILIFAGEDEMTMAAQLGAAGLITGDTKLGEDPRS